MHILRFFALHPQNDQTVKLVSCIAQSKFVLQLPLSERGRSYFGDVLFVYHVLTLVRPLATGVDQSIRRRNS